MVSHDSILPTHEPSQFDKCFYWILSLLFVILIHIPIVILMATQNFEFIQIVWKLDKYNHDYHKMFQDEAHQMGILIDILFIIPTICTLGSVVLLLILKLIGGALEDCGDCDENEMCMLRMTASVFWCLFSKQYFEVVAMHRGHNKNADEPYTYSSFLSFKKRRKKSSGSLLNGAMSHQDISATNNIVHHPKEPPDVSANILSSRDSLSSKQDPDDTFANARKKRHHYQYQHKKRNKNKDKKKRNQSVNSDETQELQQFGPCNVLYIFHLFLFY